MIIFLSLSSLRNRGLSSYAAFENQNSKFCILSPVKFKLSILCFYSQVEAHSLSKEMASPTQKGKVFTSISFFLRILAQDLISIAVLQHLKHTVLDFIFLSRFSYQELRFTAIKLL